MGSITDKEQWVKDDGANPVIAVRGAFADEIPALHAMIAAEIGPGVASLEVMKSVHHSNSDSFWVVYRDGGATGEPDTLIGCYAFLFPTEAGHEALLARTLDTVTPPLAMLAREGERPAAVYFWAVVARRVAAVSTRLVAIGLGARLYGKLPVYARAGTLGGLRSVQADPGAEMSGQIGDLFRLDGPQQKPVLVAPPA